MRFDQARIRAAAKCLPAEAPLDEQELFWLLGQHKTAKARELLSALAQTVCCRHYGDKVYVRGLIEFTNYCRNNCYYCGIRRDNKGVLRYRLKPQAIVSLCQEGYLHGYRTFVLQGGEDPYYTDHLLSEMIKEIKSLCPGAALTLSVGERSPDSYRRLFEAGADRYLLRHEAAAKPLYESLHPPQMEHQARLDCLLQLRRIGYQVGCGMMVGAPGQGPADLVRDLWLMRELKPQMIGIGPFIPQAGTPFAQRLPGGLSQTLLLLSVLRLMFPRVLLPATTALETIAPKGRQQGILAGANVIMLNITPVEERSKYLLYDNKYSSGRSIQEDIDALSKEMADIGRQAAMERGDAPGFLAEI